VTRLLGSSYQGSLSQTSTRELGPIPWLVPVSFAPSRDRHRLMLRRLGTTGLSPAAIDDHAPTLDQAYALYVPYVAKLALRLLGRPDEVDDLIQDVFVIATERFASLRDQAALRGWLAGITVNTAVRRLRKRRLRRLVSLDQGGQADLAPFLGEAATAEHHRLLSEIFTALDRVPAAERVAWSLRVLEDEPMEVVARLCGCSVSTAKRRVAAAQNVLDKAVRS
jgi:RNA polymerase sigma-70 factor, ECF subfamily